MEAEQKTDVPVEHVVAVLEHIDYSFGLMVQLIKNELSLEECKTRKKESYENLKRFLFPERYLKIGVPE